MFEPRADEADCVQVDVAEGLVGGVGGGGGGGVAAAGVAAVARGRGAVAGRVGRGWGLPLSCVDQVEPFEFGHLADCVGVRAVEPVVAGDAEVVYYALRWGAPARVEGLGGTF